MIDLYFSPTPNGLKVRLFLEEAGLPYRIVPVRLSAGEQFAPEFVAISPSSKIPVIVDHEPADGGKPIPVFESGAILLYLAEKTGRLLPADPRDRLEAHGQSLEAFPALARWFRSIGERAATRRVYEGVEDVYTRPGRPAAAAPVPVR